MTAVAREGITTDVQSPDPIGDPPYGALDRGADLRRQRFHSMKRSAAVALALAIGGIFQPAGAEPDRDVEAERVARAYVAAYSAADWNGMERYMSPDFVLVDHTNPDPGFLPEYRTPATALGMLRKFGTEGGVHALDFDFPTVFASNGVVVFQGYVNTRSTPPGRDATFVWRTRQVTIITIRDGLVERHEDLADYTHAVVSRAAPRP